MPVCPRSARKKRKKTTRMAVAKLFVLRANANRKVIAVTRKHDKKIERRHWRRPGVFIVKLEQISGIILVFPLLTLNR